MSDPQPSSSSSPIQHNTHNGISENKANNSNSNANNSSNVVRRERPARECTKRAAARLQAAAAAEAEAAVKTRKKKGASRKERLAARLLREEEDEDKLAEEEEELEEGEEAGSPSSRLQCSKIVTQLVGEPEPSQLPRWGLRSMWQLASILNFLNVFRPLLNIRVEFSAEEFETALITPNDTLGDIHMPLLKAIPPVTRMALGHNTWITVLCRKLRDWWHWVAEGELPIVASQGAEIEAYSALDPAVRVVILKALCDIRVEQEDIRNYIDGNLKQGVHLSLFRKERIGGDSHGTSYWYEDDPIIGHRLYREIRKIEVKKGKGKNVQPIPSSCYQWETVATNLDEFQDVSEKLFTSKNRTEASVGKKLKNNMLAEVERVHKRKEKLLKKQHRQALMLDNMLNMDGLSGGRSLRDRKPVTYTFDDYDRSINEAIKITKNGQPSAEPTLRREGAIIKHETSTNGRLGSPPHLSQQVSFRVHSPKSPEFDEYDEDHEDEQLDRSNRRRQRPQRYAASEFVEELSENEPGFDSDDDIMGEAVYDDEYLRKRKQRKVSSSSEGDDEYHWDEENPEDEEEEDEDEDFPSASEESDEPRSRRFKKLPGRTRRETKLRSVGNHQSGLRRSNRATRNRINYSHLEMSDSEAEAESIEPEMSNGSEEHYDASDNAEFSMGSEDSEENNDNEEVKVEQAVDVPSEMATADQNDVPKRISSPDQDQVDIESGGKRRFLDLNELAPGSGFDDGPNSVMKDEGADDF